MQNSRSISYKTKNLLNVKNSDIFDLKLKKNNEIKTAFTNTENRQ